MEPAMNCSRSEATSKQKSDMFSAQCSLCLELSRNKLSRRAFFPSSSRSRKPSVDMEWKEFPSSIWVYNARREARVRDLGHS